MAIFKYTLPSGARFQMTAPDGTTQVEADKIFYEQVAAGTFVGYQKGDSISHPTEVLANFGLSRLERGTAGVDDKTLLSVVNGLPTVATLPSLTSIPVTNPVTSADYLQVNTNAINGQFSLGQTEIGPLSPVQVQTLMGQLASIVDQPANTVTQQKGIGKYGFNCQQLERAGIIKPGFCDRYCPVDPTTQQNPDNFVEIMSTTSGYTGNGVTSLSDITSNEALQNQIQQTLMSQSYNSLLAAGTIQPQSAPPPPPSTGQVYDSNNGVLIATTGLALLASGISFANSGGLANTFGNLFSSSSNANSILGSASIGSIPDGIKNLGNSLVSSFSSGLSSLESGAVALVKGAGNSIQAGWDQITGLASGNTSLNSIITSNLNGDIGALITNNSKYGALATQSWAQGQNLYNNLPSSFGSISSLSGASLPSLSPDMLSNLDTLGKGSQFGINFADFNLSSLVSSVQPAAGFTNTVDRSTVDAAVTRVIGSEKIASPSFELPSLASLGIEADINKAKQALSQISSTSSAGFGQSGTIG